MKIDNVTYFDLSRVSNVEIREEHHGSMKYVVSYKVDGDKTEEIYAPNLESAKIWAATYRGEE